MHCSERQLSPPLKDIEVNFIVVTLSAKLQLVNDLIHWTGKFAIVGIVICFLGYDYGND